MDGARPSLFHTPAGRTFVFLVPDSGAISNLSLFHVTPDYTHIMGDNILEDCSSPQMGNCAHSHDSTQPNGEFQAAQQERYRVRLSLAHVLGTTVRGDRSRGTHNRATDTPQYTVGRDKVTDCRLPSVSTAAQNHALLAGGEPVSQPREEGGIASQGTL